MSNLLMTMARQAEDNEKLLASHIHAYADRNDKGWADIAHQLAISSDQLSRLALCRVPHRDHHDADVKRIAEYVGMEPATLAWFLEGAVSPSRGRVRAAPSNGKSARQRTRTRREPVFTLRRFGAAVAFLALAAFLGAFVLTGTQEASAATLVVSQGQATLVNENQTLIVFTSHNETQVAQGGTVAVSTGDAIGVPQGGSAYLRLNDGSTIDLAGGTVIEVAELVTTDDSYRVRFDMLAGRTVSRVQRLLGAGDTFEIGTPSSTASVRGTVFTVEVIDDKTTFVAVSEGTVWFEMDGETVELHAGDEITGHSGDPLVVTETPTAEPTDEPAAEPTTDEPTDTPPTPTPDPTATPTTEPESELAPPLFDTQETGPSLEPDLDETEVTQEPVVVPSIEVTDPPAVVTDPPPVDPPPTDPPPDDPDTPDNPPDPPADPPADPPVDPPGEPPVDLGDGDGPPPGQSDDGDDNSDEGSSDDKDSDPDDGNNGRGNDDKDK